VKSAIRTALFAAMLGCVFSPLAAAATAGQPLDEVQVDGQSMADLRAGVTKAEKKFLALYNKLNRNGKYAVSCRDSANTGTRLAKRSCSSRAEDEAIADQARQYLGAVDMNLSLTSTASANAAASTNPNAPVAGGPAAAAAAASAPAADAPASSSSAPSDAEVAGTLRSSRSAFEQNLEELLGDHPDLRQLMDEYIQARKRLETARTRQSGKQQG